MRDGQRQPDKFAPQPRFAALSAPRGQAKQSSVVEFESSLFLPGESATEELGAKIAKGLGIGDLVALSGELGTGKTALARAILRSLGITEEVPSPSFTLVQSYNTESLGISHFDLYRLGGGDDLVELGLDEALQNGAVLLEWPEHGLSGALLKRALRIALIPAGENGRMAKISGPARWQALVAGNDS